MVHLRYFLGGNTNAALCPTYVTGQTGAIRISLTSQAGLKFYHFRGKVTWPAARHFLWKQRHMLGH